jgi:hypothetical protein
LKVEREMTARRPQRRQGTMVEFARVRQVPGESHRRWFYDDEYDLIVWTEGSRVTGFQLCYDKRQDQRAVTWRLSSGFSHDRIDEGDTVPGKPRSPVLEPDGVFDARGVAEDFRAAASGIDPQIRELVYRVLMDYPR